MLGIFYKLVSRYVEMSGTYKHNEELLLLTNQLEFLLVVLPLVWDRLHMVEMVYKEQLSLAFQHGKYL